MLFKKESSELKPLYPTVKQFVFFPLFCEKFPKTVVSLYCDHDVLAHFCKTTAHTERGLCREGEMGKKRDLYSNS